MEIVSGELCSEPNIHARPAALKLSERAATFHGYQEFTLTKHAVSASRRDNQLQIKQGLLAKFFNPSYFKDKTLLDLGTNNGFFSFWAIQSGAKEAIALDLDDIYLRNVTIACDHLGFSNVRTVNRNIVDWDEPADVVIALALIHWLYSCTSYIGSLSKVVEFLSSLTNYMLIIEWIDPKDPAIEYFDHLNWNPECIEEPYTLSNFERALHTYFARVEIIGEVSPTRKIYTAFRHKHLIDASNPLPLIFEPRFVISSKLLTTFEGIDYWSRVYKHPIDQSIVKQATLDLASREYFLLKEFDSIYFPKALAYKIHDGFSEVTLEYVEGHCVEEVISEINISRERFADFCFHCLNILDLMFERSIVHRDLYPTNVLMRDGIPVLIDFGWAISEKYPYWSPNELGWLIRPPDKSFSDIFAMGKIIELVNDDRYPEFKPLIELMVASEVSLRIEDLEILRVLFEKVTNIHKTNGSDDAR
jgi:hypothetical protein